MSLTSNSDLVRLVAFYLPQYHPIAENDAWWGEGFTDWDNVRKAKPLFSGHSQPYIPAELGYYDLRDPGVSQAQADLASEYGIHGFCYYHYWFNGKHLLEHPFDAVLSSGKPDLPFFLCWANENWTRAWDGSPDQILIQQHYDPTDDRRHIAWLMKAFQDERYIRVDGKPLFLVYRVSLLPRPLETASIWREEARKLGMDLYLCTVESLAADRIDPARVGFDAAIEFQPDWFKLGSPSRRIGKNSVVYDYPSVVKRMLQKEDPGYTRYPCITPSWDNSARRSQEAAILENSTPDLYQEWLENIICDLDRDSPDENLVFINAWNEWAEGAYLEPCQKWGRMYLEATRNALENCRTHLSLNGKSVKDDVNKEPPEQKLDEIMGTYLPETGF